MIELCVNMFVCCKSNNNLYLISDKFLFIEECITGTDPGSMVCVCGLKLVILFNFELLAQHFLALKKPMKKLMKILADEKTCLNMCE